MMIPIISAIGWENQVQRFVLKWSTFLWVFFFHVKFVWMSVVVYDL